jgi:hypothetical protein
MSNNNNERKYFYSGPAIRDFSGFLNYVDADKYSDDALILALRLDVSHNVPSEDGRKKYTNKGESPFFRLKVYKDHEAFSVIDRLITEGKVVDGRAEPGVKLWVKDGFIRTHFWTKENEKYGTTIFAQGTLNRGAKLTTERPEFQAEAKAVNDTPVDSLEDDVDF